MPQFNDIFASLRSANRNKGYGTYDIRGAGQYGLEQFDPEETRRRQRELYQQQIAQGMQGAEESALASGSFNPEISSYRASQSARNAMYGADVDLDKYAHEDQYKLMQSLLGIDAAKLGREGLEFQKYQYEDSKPSWLSGALDLALGLGSAIPFDEGGVIPDSDYIKDKYGGYIPPIEANSPPIPTQGTEDNTLIKAKTGEYIMPEEAVKAFGRDTLDGMRDMAKNMMVTNSPMARPTMGGGGGGAGMMANTMGTGTGNMGWYNPNSSQLGNVGALMGRAVQKIGGMYQGGAEVAATGDPEIEALENTVVELTNSYMRASELGDTYQMDFIRPQLQNAKAQLEGLKIQRRQTPPPEQQPTITPPTYAGGGQVGGNERPTEKTVTIKTKPVVSKDAGIYSGSGFSRPMG